MMTRSISKTVSTAATAAAVVVLTSVRAVEAQIPAIPHSLGSGGAFVGVARGSDAIFVNPANLALPGTDGFSFSLGGIGLSGTTLGPTFEDFVELVTEDEGDGGQPILDAIPSSGMEMDFTGRISVASLQIGRLAVGAMVDGTLAGTVGRDVVDLMVNGFEEDRFDYQIGNTALGRAAHMNIAAAYAQPIGPISLGVTGHYLRGNSLARSGVPEISYGESPHLMIAEVFSPRGSGWSVDVGAAVQPLSRLTVGVALANAAGSMKWDDLQVRDAVFDSEQIEEMSVSDFRDQFEQSERPLTGADLETYGWLAEGLMDDAALPQTLRIGAALSFGTGTTITAAVEDRLTESSLLGGWNRNAGIGLRQTIAFIGLSAGYATDGEGHHMVTGGIGLGPLNVNVGKLEGHEEDITRSGYIITFGIDR